MLLPHGKSGLAKLEPATAMVNGYESKGTRHTMPASAYFAA